MEFKNIDNDLIPKEEVIRDIKRHLKFEIEWHFETAGEIMDEENAEKAALEELQDMGLGEEELDLLADDIAEIYEEISHNIENEIKYNIPHPRDPKTGVNFYDNNI